ncbi:MAG: tRNA (guanosine(37)-N1)-methyltransferase TrmD [Alphaproteobacteria bacterium]|nr:tRNA (guanosine(37)-N1)-methyltransferase TrmD [Alphaproteobacteria bacterium]
MNKAHWHINILTLFPEMFPGSLGLSLSGKALEKGLWSYRTVNMRDFGLGVHKAVDDTPFGGGAGMVLRADVVEDALFSLPSQAQKNIYLSPRGKTLTQEKVIEFSKIPELTLLCGRYEGVDQRVLDAHNFEEISVGDYVLSGGEPAALVLMDACIRLLDGVMGNDQTPDEESFSHGLLEYPHYTKPANWVDSKGVKRDVPEILTSGHHKNIEKWRKEKSESLTKDVRPDLWEKYKDQ